MSDYEVQRERIVERPVPVTERVVEREVPVTRRRTVVERRTMGGGFGYGPINSPAAGIIAAAIAILVLLLIVGVFTR
ncbi:MAG: hypothetical protein QOI47_1144 [Actinomycetota bacterium]|nr:hypothetical protein [Actinomycetota bacterium]